MPATNALTDAASKPADSANPEAVPTFATYRQRIEQKDLALHQEIDHFLGLLRVLGTPMIDDAQAHFIYHNPFAREVKLAGEFPSSGWGGVAMTRLGETGIFHLSLALQAPARIEYKFQVDGQWLADPFCANRVDNGVGGENSCLVLGRFDEPAELEWHAALPHGNIEEFVLSSRYLKNQRKVYVYLPAQYGEMKGQELPALYVHDGGEYLTRARLAIALDNLIHAGEIPPLIVVMVNPVQRESEYIGNEDYAALVEHELIPRIESSYRARGHRDSRAVMGASMGGLIATYLALTRPHLFAKVAGQSSAFFLNEEKIVALAGALATPVIFYFDVAETEAQFIPAHKRLMPILESKQCRCFYQEVPGGHNWTTWRAHLKEILVFHWGEDKFKRARENRESSVATAAPLKQSAKPQPPPGR